MNNRQTLMASAAAGLAAALLAWFWFTGKERALRELSAPAPVLVAAGHVAGGTRIDATMVEVRTMPRAFIQPGALKSPEEAKGMMALAPFAPGEQMLANKLAVSGVALAFSVPPGKRAVTVAVDPASGVAGLLKPGDLVDVMVTVDEGGAPRTSVVIQAAPVLAVGREFSAKPAQEGAGGALLAQPDEAGTVTIAASPFDAEQVTHLEQAGRLKLVLRAPGDRERIPLPALRGVRSAAAGGDDEEVRRR